MPRDEGEARIKIAMRDGNARITRPSDRGRHSGDNFECHTRPRQRLGFLAPAPEDKWISTLQPHDALAGLAFLDEKGIDLFLRHRMRGRPFSNVDSLTIVRAIIQQFRIS